MIFSVFQKKLVLGYSCSTLLWYWCYYPHRSRDALSPVCGIFLLLFNKVSSLIYRTVLKPVSWYTLMTPRHLKGYMTIKMLLIYKLIWLHCSSISSTACFYLLHPRYIYILLLLYFFCGSSTFTCDSVHLVLLSISSRFLYIFSAPLNHYFSSLYSLLFYIFPVSLSIPFSSHLLPCFIISSRLLSPSH